MEWRPATADAADLLSMIPGLALQARFWLLVFLVALAVGHLGGGGGSAFPGQRPPKLYQGFLGRASLTLTR